MRAYMDSEEGEAALDEWAKRMSIKNDIAQVRYLKIDKYLETHDFADVMKRLEEEHGEDHRDKCYKKGYEPYPNHKFELLFDYISEEFSHVDNDLIPQDFLAQCYFFKGYYFTVYCGQGCFYRVYDSKFKHILQI